MRSRMNIISKIGFTNVHEFGMLIVINERGFIL